MDRENYIKEMLKVTCGYKLPWQCGVEKTGRCPDKWYAAKFYDAGYRKADEVCKETIKEILNFFYGEDSPVKRRESDNVFEVPEEELKNLVKKYGVKIEK